MALEQPTTKLAEFQRNCCGFLKLQVERLLGQYRAAPMDILAANCRNVFELLLVVKYFGTTEDDAHTFLLQAEVDRILIHEGILEWSRAVNPDGIKHMDYFKTSKQKGLKPPKYPTVSAMAEKVGMKTEYDGFYKFYSKYIHPSSWLINKPAAELERDGYREILVMQTVTYGHETAKLLGAA
jgi:hypothetical protein